MASLMLFLNPNRSLAYDDNSLIFAQMFCCKIKLRGMSYKVLQFLSTVYYPKRLEGLEFGTGTESPGYANGIHMGIMGRLHVNTRIADVEYVFPCYFGLVHYLMHDMGRWLDRNIRPLAKDAEKVNAREIVGNKFFRGRLVFVGCNGKEDTSLVQGAKQFLYAGVWSAEVGIVHVVVFREMSTQKRNIFLCA